MVLLTIMSASSIPGWESTHDLEAVAVDLNTQPPLFCIGALLTVVGTSLRIISYRCLGRFFTFELSIRDSHRLVTSGPYSVVRHPSYAAGCIFLLGSLWCQLGPGSIWACLGLWGNMFGFIIGAGQICFAAYASYIAAVLRVGREDRMLREHFGREWETWAQKTPYKVIPLIY